MNEDFYYPIVLRRNKSRKRGHFLEDIEKTDGFNLAEYIATNEEYIKIKIEEKLYELDKKNYITEIDNQLNKIIKEIKNNDDRTLKFEAKKLIHLRESYYVLRSRYNNFNEGHYIREHPDRFDVFSEIYKKHPLVNTGIYATVFSVLQPGYNIEIDSKKGKQVIEDFINDPEIHFIEFLQNVLIDYLVYGNAYIEIVEYESDIIDLVLIPPEWMFVDCDAHGNIYAYYEFSPYGQNIYMPDEIIHWKRLGRREPYGESIIKPLIDPVRRNLDVWEDAITCLHQYGAPRILWTIGNKDMPKFSKDYIKSFKNEVVTAGIDSDIFAPYGIDGKPIDTRSAIIDYNAYLNKIDLDIIAGIKVPPVTFARGDIRGETATESLEDFDKRNETLQKLLSINVLIPIFTRLLELKGIMYKKRLNIHWNKFERIEKSKREQNIVKLKEAGILTPNEARRKIGITTPIMFKNPITKDIDKEYGDYAQPRASGAGGLGVTSPPAFKGKPIASISQQTQKGEK